MCQEMYELPLGAAACPDTACGGLLERRFTPETAPAVIRGADPLAAAVSARALDAAAAGDFDHMKGAMQHKPEFATTPAPESGYSETVRDRNGITYRVPAMAGAIPADAKLGSRMYSAPTLKILSGRNPAPGPGTKTG